MIELTTVRSMGNLRLAGRLASEGPVSSVLITLGGRGIGRATALELAGRGHRVVATARDVGSLAGLPVGQRLELDVADPHSVDEAVEAAGDIDVLISNAGAIMLAPTETTPPEEFERLLRQNTVGALRVVQAVLPAMRQRGSGRILFISSVLGRIAFSTRGAYAATKWAFVALAETLAMEVGRFGIDVALLEPASVSSGAFDDPLRYPGEACGQLGELIAAARVPAITVEETARLIADAVEAETLPLRIPVGEPARAALARRRTQLAHRVLEVSSPAS
jgi:NAD(P)-dependent dehydrogenase (short-subunit alcohol dehydrogenase family)